MFPAVPSTTVPPGLSRPETIVKHNGNSEQVHLVDRPHTNHIPTMYQPCYRPHTDRSTCSLLPSITAMIILSNSCTSLALKNRQDAVQFFLWESYIAWRDYIIFNYYECFFTWGSRKVEPKLASHVRLFPTFLLCFFDQEQSCSVLYWAARIQLFCFHCDLTSCE